jgi:hypothetical protein
MTQLVIELDHTDYDGYILTASCNDKLIAACTHANIEVAQLRLDTLLIELKYDIYTPAELN